MKRMMLLALAAAIVLLLCGCDPKPAERATEPSAEAVQELSLMESGLTLAEAAERYPGLQKLDAMGCTDYALIEAYIAAHPETEVTYAVSLGSREFAPDTRQIVLTREDYSYPALVANLKYLRGLESLYFEQTTLMPDAIGNLRTIYPDVQISYSVEFCGMLVRGDARTLDVSALEPELVLSQGALLTMFPELHTIELMTAEGGTAYTLEQAVQLQQAAPEAVLHYTFQLFGKTVSTTDVEVTYVNQDIGNQPGALDTLRTALSIMGGCERFVLDNCKFKNEELAQVRNEFRSRTKVVWRVWFANGGCLTDRQVIRYVYGLYDSNCADLIYCEDAEYIDVGHNEYLKNCEFVSHMTKLKAIILSGSMISDLTPLANCASLEFLEIAYCGYVEDISPLAFCSNLKRLNIAYTKASELSALDALDLEVMVDACSRTSPEERERFDRLHPDCLTQHTGDAKDDNPYTYPWRYEADGEPNPYYALLKEKFNYPNAFTTLY